MHANTSVLARAALPLTLALATPGVALAEGWPANPELAPVRDGAAILERLVERCNVFQFSIGDAGPKYVYGRYVAALGRGAIVARGRDSLTFDTGFGAVLPRYVTLRLEGATAPDLAGTRLYAISGEVERDAGDGELAGAKAKLSRTYVSDAPYAYGEYLRAPAGRVTGPAYASPASYTTQSFTGATCVPGYN